MNFASYQDECERTMGSDSCLANYGLGIAGEAGEVADLIKKHLYQGHLLDLEKIKLELGDVLWYVTAVASTLDIALADVAEANIKKLKKRYPDGFSVIHSTRREEVGAK